MPEIKNLKKAAGRILKAVEKKERIILYGDSDLDGMSSVIVLKEAIKNLGGEVRAVYFPDREVEGYGLNESALQYLKKYAPALLILLDCGIGNFEEVNLAKKLGIEVIIIDHHEPLEKLPLASVVVNVKQKGDKYPFKQFAAAGIVYRLAEALLKEKLSTSLRKNFLELVALATISDMMPKAEDNLEFLGEGLTSLLHTLRPGLKVFWNLGSVGKENIGQFSQQVISACHSGKNNNHLNDGYLLLISSSIKEAENLAKQLLENAELRYGKIKDVFEEVKERISNKPEEKIIFEGDKSWPVLIAGPVSSKICQIYKKPVFLYSEKKGYCQGAVRTPVGLDGVKAMRHCSKDLETYGGHPQAGGFRVKKEDVDNFKDCLVQYFKNKR
ncbi:MAG: DHH family phosphoesterase [Candidatus Nealsonbacteria bacterium]|nr:DHH family phosphoesterase [Candidatus Nealsonbacteria bacterium]